MPDFLATYDLRSSKSPHSEFLRQAVKNGWRLWITAGKDWCRLPNTTLEGSFASIEKAAEALKATKAATQAELGVDVYMDKWVVTPSDLARFYSDEKRPLK